MFVTNSFVQQIAMRNYNFKIYKVVHQTSTKENRTDSTKELNAVCRDDETASIHYLLILQTHYDLLQIA